MARRARKAGQSRGGDLVLACLNHAPHGLRRVQAEHHEKEEQIQVLDIAEMIAKSI